MGRRKVQLIFNLLGIFGVAICMIENLWMLCIGRLIYGFAVGVESVGMPRYLDEVVPLRRYNVCIALYVLAINLGYVFALDSAILLPPDENTQELIDDEVAWRVILGQPMVWFFLQTLSFLFYIKMDGPAFLLSKHDMEGARASFESIYQTNGDDSHFEKFVDEINKSKKLAGSTKVSLGDALCKDENYMRAAWVNIINIIFHELAGINVILQYSNTILEDIIGTDDDGGFNARQGTYVISLINFLSAATSVWTINTFGRRILLLIGHALMALIHVGIGFAIIFDKNALVLIGICAFLFAYQNTSGPIAY